MNKKVKTSITPKDILENSIRELGLTSRAKLFWIIHPLLIDVATRFADYVGQHSISASGASLLNETIAEAFEKHRNEVDVTENDQVGQALFARTLLARSKEVFAQQLVVDDGAGGVIWNPFVESSTAFLAKFPDAKVTVTRIPQRIEDRIAQIFMLVKLVPEQMLDSETITELFNDETIKV